MIAVSEEDLAEKYVRYNERGHERFYLLPQNELDFEGIDVDPERGVTRKRRPLSAYDYFLCCHKPHQPTRF